MNTSRIVLMAFVVGAVSAAASAQGDKPVLGAEAAFTENIGAFLELSVLDETTLTFGASYTF